MAITTNTVAVTGPRHAQVGAGVTPWQINASSADASGCEEIKATPGTGYALVVERLVVHIGAAINVTFGEDEGAGGAVAAVLLGPLGGAAGTYVLDCRDRPIQMTANKALVIDASGAGLVCVYAEGYTRLS
jgi:hypothetical protein